MTNITLAFLDHTTVEEIPKLNPNELMILQAQLEQEQKLLKKRKQILEDGLLLKYQETIDEALIGDGKDSGTVHFPDHRHVISADVPKKVTWDADILKKAISKIPVEERDDVVKVTYTIEENRYKNWPRSWKEHFKDARTVKAGKPKISIKEASS